MEHFTKLNDPEWCWQVGDTLYLRCSCGTQLTAPAYTVKDDETPGIAGKFAEHLDAVRV